MAGQERTAVRTTGSRGQLTSDMVRLYNTSYRTSYARGGVLYVVINDIKRTEALVTSLTLIKVQILMVCMTFKTRY